MKTTIASQRKAVIGLGKTGQACARFLKTQGFAVDVYDTRTAPPDFSALQRDFPDMPFRLGGLDQATLCNAGEIVVSPGVSLREPAIQSAVDAGIPIIGDIELFRRYVSEPVIAITGSNAKSTVTTLVGAMLQDAGYDALVAGNIGIPVVDLLNQQRSAHFYVLELSSFQLESTQSLNAEVATILNISADHMDRYESLEDYIAAKQRIYCGARNLVYLQDDTATHPQQVQAGQQVYSFTRRSPMQQQFGVKHINNETWLAFEDLLILPVSALKLRGDHNVLNALAALALGYSVGLSFPAMADTLRRFEGLPHRCQYVATLNGVEFFNDSKGTNVGATLAAIRGLAPGITGRIVLIAGGQGKGADFSELAPVLADVGRHAVLLGEDAGRLQDALGQALPISRVDSLLAAVMCAMDNAKAGDVVLLSPACASFDMFSGYEDRGEQFVAVVNSLQEGC